MRSVYSHGCVLTSPKVVLDHGIAIAQGKPEAIVRDPAVVQSYLGAEPV